MYARYLRSIEEKTRPYILDDGNNNDRDDGREEKKAV